MTNEADRHMAVKAFRTRQEKMKIIKQYIIAIGFVFLAELLAAFIFFLY